MAPQISITEQARRQANLKLLQKTCDATIQTILQSATHVVLYEFKDNNWNKCGVEGSCFLVASPTSVQLIILNRHSANNFILPVVPTLQVQDQAPYLILQSPSRTSGIWFHSADERIAVTSNLQAVLPQLAAGTFAFPARAASAPPPRAPLPGASSTTVATAAAAAAATTTVNAAEVTQDERDHLAALLSQTALAATSGGGDANTNNNNQRSHSAPKPVATTNPTSSASPPHMPGGSVALDKKALQSTLLSLIQDERFLDLLHSQYLRVVHARAKKNSNSNNNNA